MLSRTAWEVVHLKSLNTQTPGRSCMDSRPTFYIDAIREMEKGWVLLKPCRSEKGRSEQSLHHGPVSTACHLPWDYSRWYCLCTPTTVPPNNLTQFPKPKSSQVPGQKKKKGLCESTFQVNTLGNIPNPLLTAGERRSLGLFHRH